MIPLNPKSAGSIPQTHAAWAAAFVECLGKSLGPRLVSAVVYGSVARGHEKGNSDIDLLLVIEGLTPGRYRRRLVLEPAFEEWDRAYGSKVPFISTIIKTPEEAKAFSPIYLDMTDRRIILMDRDHFFEGILTNLKGRLDRLGARRRKLGKIEYWDLKPDYKPGEVFEI